MGCSRFKIIGRRAEQRDYQKLRASTAALSLWVPGLKGRLPLLLRACALRVVGSPPFTDFEPLQPTPVSSGLVPPETAPALRDFPLTP